MGDMACHLGQGRRVALDAQTDPGHASGDGQRDLDHVRQQQDLEQVHELRNLFELERREMAFDSRKDKINEWKRIIGDATDFRARGVGADLSETAYAHNLPCSVGQIGQS